MEFKEFNLHPDLQRGITEAGYINCMPVQEQVLTHAFGGQDLYVQSQTGTGKTAAFLIVIFQRLLTESPLKGKKAIIMVPTRELAVQVEEEAKLLGKYLSIKIGSFYGGVGYTQQQQLLKDNVQVLVGTPGRVLDLNKSGRMNLMEIAFLILDEADRMFDMGFYPDLRKLIKVVPPADRRQTMLFSATLNAWVKNLAWEYTKSPFEIEIAPETVTVDEVEQVLFHVPSKDKMKILLGIMEREQPESAIIFCNTKRYTEIVAKRLRLNGYDCEFIIGDLPQVKRLKIIDDIKAGVIRYLVATDVAARGLDIEGLALVVNYDLPVESENYVHRIGRTARAGKTGKAITLASEQDVYELPAIERYIGNKIPAETIGEELYAGDKSEGKRIYTEFYEDRHEGRGPGPRRDRSGRASGARSGGFAGEGRRRGGRTVEGDERGGSGEGGRDRRDSPKKAAGEFRREGREGGTRNGTRPPPKNGLPSERGSRSRGREEPAGEKTGEFYQLSFEERMAVYKQKYEGGRKPVNRGGTEGPEMPDGRESPEASSQGRQRKQGAKRRPEGKGRQGQRPRSREEEPKRADPAAREKPSRRRGGGKNAQVLRGDAPGPVPAQRAETAVPAAPKKGILSRIFGLFKKD
ncbi:MAG: DEAD/DEAH box helicase [Treponema sp.]|jgi:ATP-dependent RNA helicase RhlB|nr:DEAD/DEAH box helicase [Treponema sp.]